MSVRTFPLIPHGFENAGLFTVSIAIPLTAFSICPAEGPKGG
ncbi:hypothetical protein Mal65_29310 [Crateriforma conspicua]|nr:hypothetical protein Mal65_29310 [Crateriforma conspicua]